MNHSKATSSMTKKSQRRSVMALCCDGAVLQQRARGRRTTLVADVLNYC